MYLLMYNKERLNVIMVNIKSPKPVEKSPAIDHNARHPFLPILPSIDRTNNNNTFKNDSKDKFVRYHGNRQTFPHRPLWRPRIFFA
uniref:Uncharacterized protein n=1 Tax=Romanomermis culicivorax TaxID=13658 RepID=A0A915I3S3_ROMCU